VIQNWLRENRLLVILGQSIESPSHLFIVLLRPMTEPQSSEPKIIVDTDWKEQVAKEKAMAEESEAKHSATGQNEVASERSDSATSDEEVAVMSQNEHRMQAPPPASFEMLVTKHYIDTLDLIGEKTKGNLSSDESKMLSEALHALRMMYVNVKQPAE
jgi:hypothetical protein